MKKILFPLCILCLFAAYGEKPVVNAAAADYESGIDQLIEDKNEEKNTGYLLKENQFLCGCNNRQNPVENSD